MISDKGNVQDRMTASRVISSRLDKRSKFEGRTNDRSGRTRAAGFSKFPYQQSRGKTTNPVGFGSKLNVRKNLLKPYRRGNLSMMNRRYYNRNNNNTFFSKNRRKGANVFEDRLGNTTTNRRGEFSSRKQNISKFGNTRRNNFRNGFRNNRRRNFGNRRVNYKNVHEKVGKLSSKDLDAELDNYMGASNVRSRLDNDLDNYFKNNTASKQMESNK